MKRRYLGLVLAFAVCAAVAADKPLDVRDLMTANQFHQMGLDKLTPEELAAFNAWLATYGHAPAAATGGSAASLAVPGMPSSAASLPSAQPDQHATGMLVNAPASPAPSVAAPAAATSNVASFGQATLPAEERGEPNRIETRIPGTFTGWSGRTAFTLENGQVWVQSEPGVFETHLQDPKVVIKKMAFGYLLTIPGQSATVFVRRTH